ncbi:hypothetical protein [Phreatobacter sp.]|nr:hypothetical protein [Phreatobacter sp.]
MITLSLSIVFKAIVGAAFGVNSQIMPSPIPDDAVMIGGVPVS